MRKHDQILTLGTAHYKAHFRFLRKSKDFKSALWSERYGNKETNILRISFFLWVWFSRMKAERCNARYSVAYKQGCSLLSWTSWWYIQRKMCYSIVRHGNVIGFKQAENVFYIHEKPLLQLVGDVQPHKALLGVMDSTGDCDLSCAKDVLIVSYRFSEIPNKIRVLFETNNHLFSQRVMLKDRNNTTTKTGLKLNTGCFQVALATAMLFQMIFTMAKRLHLFTTRHASKPPIARGCPYVL